jgi:hypothetical protein
VVVFATYPNNPNQWSPHYPIPLQGRSAYWTRPRGHALAAGPGQRQQAYEVNIWTWRYGRGRPLMVSIAKAERIRAEQLSKSRFRAAETRKRRSEAAAAAGAAEDGGGGSD